MTTQEYINEQCKGWRELRFKDHGATVLVANEELQLIDWRKPGTWNYGMRVILHSQWLIVVGDLFEATYQWGEKIDLKFLSTLNFDYFFGKLRASEKGRVWTTWDHQIAVARFKEMMKEHRDLKVWGPELLDGHGKDSAMDVAREIYNETGDAEFASMISSAGDVPCSMCIGHFVAMGMIYAQLNPPQAV